MNKIKFKPLNGLAVIKAEEVEEKTSGGIIIPDTAKEKLSKGEVVAVSDIWYDRGMCISPLILVGVNVLYPSYKGTEITIEGEQYLLIKESDIYGIIETDRV